MPAIKSALKGSQMPAYEHHFMPLHPPLVKEEYDALETIGTVNFDTGSDHKLVVRLLGTCSAINVIAVTIPEAACHMTERPLWMKQIMETALTSIRLSYDPGAQPLFTGNGFFNFMYESDDPEPKYQIAIQFIRSPDFEINVQNVLGVWGAIANRQVGPVAALVAEAQVTGLPPHYTVLSLMRAIELMWPESAARNAALDSREDEFAALGISSRRFRNALPEIRSRCAHGRGRGQPEPFAGIGYNDTTLRPLARLLASVVADGLRDLYGVQTALPSHATSG